MSTHGPSSEKTNMMRMAVGLAWDAAFTYLLILLRRRWLWIVGAAISGMVILIFVLAYISWPLVLFSPGGLCTKLAEVLLEAILLYLIFITSGHQSIYQFA